MISKKKLVVDEKANISFSNRVDYCIGTGRMGLALHKEYQEQLKLVQEEIGFEHIRGHGLFCDDMAIYQEYTDDKGEKQVEYNFTYLDRVMDSYRELGLKPFLELGFMPRKLASGTQTIFYWKGNTTPPQDYERWCGLVQATLSHLMERYGEEEVVTWPVEVWNEPNLPGFWENASQEEYFKLFEHTFYAVKKLDERFRIGGPAVCGGTDEIWIKAFLDFCSKKKIALDFVTRHHYTTEPPAFDGHYGYVVLSEPEEGFANLKTTRDIIDSFPEYKGLEIHITEFNTSYIPNCPVHDTNMNAAFLAEQLSRLGEGNASYSYWTFGDVFEEQGVPFTPFYGGFGLVANGCIPKPTFWTFQFFKQLQGECVLHTKEAVIVRRKDGSYRGIAWNLHRNKTKQLLLNIELPEKKGGQLYILLTKTVDKNTCNPLKIWHDLGEPSSLTKEQLKLLREAATPLIQTKQWEAKDSGLAFELAVEDNGVIYFELKAVSLKNDRGYDYQRAISYTLPPRSEE